MTIIGITGISGSGKTTVTRILAQMGGYTVEADPLAHELMKKGKPVYKDIVAAFGTGILDGNGEIHRPALGKIVFEDKEKLAELEGIIHPQVATLTMAMIAQARITGRYKFAVIDAPLLIEAGMHKHCHSCWLVTASHPVRLARIMARDNITKEAAEKRLSSRPGDDALKPYADVIIENNGDSMAGLINQVEDALKRTQGATQ